MRFRMIRYYFQCTPICRHSFLEPALPRQHHSQVVIRITVVRPQCHCPAIGRRCIVKLPHLTECVAEIVLCMWVVWLEHQRTSITVDRFIELANGAIGFPKIGKRDVLTWIEDNGLAQQIDGRRMVARL